MNKLVERTCSKCGMVKPLTEFHVRRQQAGGHNKQCKSCVSILGKAYRDADKEREVNRRKRYNQKNRESLRHKHKVYRQKNYVGRMLASASQRAKKRGLPFSLTPEDIKLPVFCPILGIELDYGIKNGGSLPSSPSLDKIIPKLGYVKGNVQVVSMKANQIKSCATPEELMLVARYFGMMA